MLLIRSSPLSNQRKFFLGKVPNLHKAKFNRNKNLERSCLLCIPGIFHLWEMFFFAVEIDDAYEMYVRLVQFGLLMLFYKKWNSNMWVSKSSCIGSKSVSLCRKICPDLCLSKKSHVNNCIVRSKGKLPGNLQLALQSLQYMEGRWGEDLLHHLFLFQFGIDVLRGSRLLRLKTILRDSQRVVLDLPSKR